MTLLKTYSTLAVIVFISIIFIKCTTTVSKTKDPTFNVEVKTIQSDLKKIVTCENINLSGKEITSDGKVNSELEISITNGKNIPTDDLELKALGKQIASDIKKSLKDSNEYNKYTVLFVTVTTDSGVTKRHWKGNDFKSEEL